MKRRAVLSALLICLFAASLQASPAARKKKPTGAAIHAASELTIIKGAIHLPPHSLTIVKVPLK